MSRHMLTNLKKTPIEIAHIIASNAKIVNLLYNDSSAALDQQMNNLPSFSDLVKDQYICFCTANMANIDNLKRNTFITIMLEDFDFSDDYSTVSGEGSIHITTNESHFALDGGRNRSLEIIDELCYSLCERKLSSAGVLNFDRISYMGFNGDYFNYKISFSIEEEVTRGVEI